MDSDNDHIPSKKHAYSATTQKICDYWNYNARKYGFSTRLNLKLDTYLNQYIDGLYPGIRHLRILDVGTGAGFAAITLAKIGHNVTGTDIAPNMISEAVQNAEREGVQAEFLIDDISHSALPSNTFDVVLFRETLFTVDEVGRAMVESRRLLKTGGHLVIMDGNYFLEQRLEEYKLRKEYFLIKYGKYEMQAKIDISNLNYAQLEETVKGLYVNRVRRPGWEVWNFLDLGFDNIKIENRDTDRFEYVSDFCKVNTPLTYSINARKTVDDPEETLDRTETDFENICHEIKNTDSSEYGILSILGGSDRLKIVKLLLVAPMNVSQLTDILDSPQNLVSYNLRLLKDARIVRAERKGHQIAYSLVDPSTCRALISNAQVLEHYRELADNQ